MTTLPRHTKIAILSFIVMGVALSATVFCIVYPKMPPVDVANYDLRSKRSSPVQKTSTKGTFSGNIVPTSHQSSETFGGGETLIRSLEELQCPPPPVTRSLSICTFKTCSNHHECHNDLACCFNGCIRTCIKPLPQPAAFDWIQDTRHILPILGPEFHSYPHSSHFVPILVPQSVNPKYVAAEAEEELVYLTGGCLISASQHRKLKQFSESSSIKQCRCSDGEVVCDVINTQA